MNPAVTISFALTAQMPLVKAVIYVIAQCLGAIVGAALVKLLGPHKFVDDSVDGGHRLGPYTSPAQGLFIEVGLTFVLVVVRSHSVIDLTTSSRTHTNCLT